MKPRPPLPRFTFYCVLVGCLLVTSAAESLFVVALALLVMLAAAIAIMHFQFQYPRSKTFVTAVLLVTLSVLLRRAWYEYEFITSILYARHVMEVSLLSLLRDALIRMAIDILPVAVVTGCFCFFFLPRTRHDLSVLLQGLSKTEFRQLKPEDQEAFKKRHELAVARMAFITAAMLALIATGSWLQDTTSKRVDVTKLVREAFLAETVMQGRIHLNGGYCQQPSGSDHCAFCADLKKAVRPGQRTGVPEDTKLNTVRAALNAVDLILYFRRVKAMSETEYCVLWTGVCSETVQKIAQHYVEHGIQNEIQHYFPYLVGPISRLAPSSPSVPMVPLDAGSPKGTDSGR